MSTNNSVITDYTSTDDAAVVRLSDGKIILQTVDFFTPIVDDPYTFGQISAANSLSDIYAMGGRPLFALNIVGFPIQKLPNEILSEIMQGGADKAAEAGIPIVGGHSIDDNEPKYGLVVTGEAIEKNIWTNAGAKEGDQIILTKPIGTGIISTAIKKEKASSNIISSAVETMKTLNKKASEVAKRNLIKIPLKDGRTLHHDVKGKNGSGKVFLRSAPAGTGIIAGGAIRSVCEVLGIQDVVAKSLGSANPHNVLKACVNGLKSQNSPKILSAIRGKKISDIVLKRETK